MYYIMMKFFLVNPDEDTVSLVAHLMSHVSQMYLDDEMFVEYADDPQLMMCELVTKMKRAGQQNMLFCYSPQYLRARYGVWYTPSFNKQHTWNIVFKGVAQKELSSTTEFITDWLKEQYCDPESEASDDGAGENEKNNSDTNFFIIDADMPYVRTQVLFLFMGCVLQNLELLTIANNMFQNNQ